MTPLLPNLRHLQLYLEVTRRRSISATARETHLTQPAVSQAIAAVELALGGDLFQRHSRGLEPSPAGQAVAKRVERALGLLEDGLAGARGSGRRSRREDLRGITATQLLALMQVAGHDSFAAAAAQAERSRSAVHRAVRQLERLLDVALVDYSTGRLLLTRDGERLARGARLAAAELAQARDEAAHLQGRGGGSTVIGAMPLARSVIVPRALLAFAGRRPDHALAILDGPYDTLLAALRQGRADVLVGALRKPSPAADVVQEHLFDDPLSIIVRRGHPLTLARRVRPVELAKFPWIAPRAGSPLREHFEALYRTLGVGTAAVPIECNSLAAARALLLESDRVMLLSEHQVHHELGTGQLAALPHPHGPLFRAIGMTTRRDWHPTPAQARLLAVLRDEADRVIDELRSPVAASERTSFALAERSSASRPR
jgi:DNA-binding transcriptional LysR family regulator